MRVSGAFVCVWCCALFCVGLSCVVCDASFCVGFGWFGPILEGFAKLYLVFDSSTRYGQVVFTFFWLLLQSCRTVRLTNQGVCSK